MDEDGTNNKNVMRTKFERFRRFISWRSKMTITRTQLMDAIENGDRGENKTDQYRRAAELAGYLKRVGRGKYKVIKKIPLMSWSHLQILAYPYRLKYQ